MISWTIGLMAKAPVVGQCKTRLARAWGGARACALYEAMLLDTMDALASLPAARFVVMAAPEGGGAARLGQLARAPWEIVPQRGEGLGARLAHAFVDLMGAGSAACLLSSDSPTVPLAPIARALETIREPGRIVCGPCDDGGYYLVGMTSLELGVLADIPWSTPQVMEATRARCRDRGLPLHELPLGYDVDEVADAERLRAELREHPERAPRTARCLAEWP
jgi:hypothetical protein